MDRLDELTGTADPLLRHVDDLLSSVGAPSGHPLWTELRRVRLLPADAVRAVAALRPSALADVAPRLRDQAQGYADLASSLPAPAEWTGDAAEAYDQGRKLLADHLTGEPESLAERLEASADLGDALAGWMRRSRESLALALGDVLGSAEAVTLAGTAVKQADTSVAHRSAYPLADEAALAAAEIAARLLRTVADAYDQADDLLEASAPLAEADLTAHGHPWSADR